MTGSFMRLPASLRAALYIAAAVVFATGCAWLLTEQRRTLYLEIHGGATMALLVLIGAVFALHAPAAWREGKNRWSGILVAAVLVTLALTGYLLYYLGDDHARHVASVVHWVVGVAMPVFLALHGGFGRRSRAAQ